MVWGVLRQGGIGMKEVGTMAFDGLKAAIESGDLTQFAESGQTWTRQDAIKVADVEVERMKARALAAQSASLRGTAAPAPASASAVLLSSREREVLERIAAGDSNKLIARVLDISPHTVKRHVANILDKLALQSRGQAAAWLRANPRTSSP